MPLIFGMPSGITDDMEMVLAAVQTWAGKADGAGKWTTAISTLGGMLPMLRVSGAGNSWTAGPNTFPYAVMAYTIIGNTMIVSFNILNTALTIATPVSQVFLRLPDGYQMGEAPAFGSGYMINNGVYQPAQINTSGTAGFLGIEKTTNAAFLDDSGGNFSVGGTLILEIAPKT